MPDNFDVAGAYMEYLNGGAPPCDWAEVQEWVQSVCRVSQENNDEERSKD